MYLRLALTFAVLPLVAASGARADVTVAFVGDMGVDAGARAVVELIERRGADLFVALGDLGYYPEGSLGAVPWTAMVDEVLGDDFPVLLVVGNHEDLDWPLYAAWQRLRIAKVPDLDCDGVPGVRALCSFRGLSIVQAAPGISEVDGVDAEDDYPSFIEASFANDENSWRICSWHKNQHAMQLGAKGDETGWGVYQACLASGAIVATAHEHSYSRTFLMDDFEGGSVVDRGDRLELAPGHSFAFVSGLGGHSVRAQESDGDRWASRYTADQGASYGALFCTFGAASARCWFEDIAGAVPDSFALGTSFAVSDEARPTDVQIDPPAEGLGDAPDGASTDVPTDARTEASMSQGSGGVAASRATGGGGGWWLAFAVFWARVCRHRRRGRV